MCETEVNCIDLKLTHENHASQVARLSRNQILHEQYNAGYKQQRSYESANDKMNRAPVLEVSLLVGSGLHTDSRSENALHDGPEAGTFFVFHQSHFTSELFKAIDEHVTVRRHY